MIQRVQTIFLLVATILAIVMVFMPLIAFPASSGEMLLLVGGISGFTQPALYLLFLPTIGIPLTQIFLFKNRILQIKIGLMAVSYWVLWTVVFSIIVYFITPSNINASLLSPKFGAILPIINISLIVMANRAIKKDEDLVRSADRIR